MEERPSVSGPSSEECVMNEDHLPVFVYGTLRPGEKNYPLFLQGKTRRETPAFAEGRLFFVRDGGYPYVLPGDGRVAGDLMELTPATYDATLSGLDRLEDYHPQEEAGSLYLRRSCSVTVASGRRRMAWIYFWNGPAEAGDRIPSGDFRRRRG